MSTAGPSMDAGLDAVGTVETMWMCAEDRNMIYSPFGSVWTTSPPELPSPTQCAGRVTSDALTGD